jgi:AcrR family transcriptional regulator
MVTLPLFDDSSKTKETIVLQSTMLFAKRGYEAVSIREIASHIGVKPSSLYNHFPSKEALFEAVIKHAEDLYLLYFRHLNEKLKTIGSFTEALDVIFYEPSKMSNDFTCHAFSLVQTEQFRDRRAAVIYTNTFLEYSVNFLKDWFEYFVSQGLARPFDCKTAATVTMHTVLVGINLRVHELLSHNHPYSFGEMFGELKQFILRQALPEHQPYDGSERPMMAPVERMTSLEMPPMDILARGED